MGYFRDKLADSNQFFSIGQLSLDIEFFRYIFDYDGAAKISCCFAFFQRCADNSQQFCFAVRCITYVIKPACFSR